MKNLMQSIPVHRGNIFTWSQKPRGIEGMTEASTLGSRFASRIYRDACDLGFFVQGKSSKKLFIWTGDEKSDGELVFSTFTSSDDPNIKIFVYNT